MLSCGAIPVSIFSYEQTGTDTDPSSHQEHDAIVLVNCGLKGLTRLGIPSTLALLIVPDTPRIFYPARNASVSGELTDDIA